MPTPPGYTGWERSSVVAWEAVEQQGGIVPDIEEDRAHFPPAWLRYPSPMRSAELLADGGAQAEGASTRKVAPERPRGRRHRRAHHGRGRVRQDGDRRRALGRPVGRARHREQGRAAQPAAPATGKPPRAGLPSTASVFFDGAKLRPETSVYRLAVKKDSSLGHVRELTRDLDHLERTIAERPPLVTPSRRGAVDDLVHKLIDEAWSLMLDKPFEEDGRALTGRALALAAALDWPGAAEQAAAVLDDVLKRKPSRADARGRARQPAAARGRARQGGVAGRGGDGQPGRLAARALRRSGAGCWRRARRTRGWRR